MPNLSGATNFVNFDDGTARPIQRPRKLRTMCVFGQGVQLVSKGVVPPRDTRKKAAKSLRLEVPAVSWDYYFLGARNRISDVEVEQRGDSLRLKIWTLWEIPQSGVSE